MQSPISPLCHLLPTRAPSPVVTTERRGPKSRCSGALARTNELMSIFDRGYRLPHLIREGCSGGHIDLPFLVPSRPHFPTPSACTRPAPRHQAYGMSPILSRFRSDVGTSVPSRTIDRRTVGQCATAWLMSRPWGRRRSCSGSVPINFFVCPFDDLQFSLAVWQEPSIVPH